MPSGNTSHGGAQLPRGGGSPAFLPKVLRAALLAALPSLAVHQSHCQNRSGPHLIFLICLWIQCKICSLVIT